jgi:protein-disulfide isomerase
MIDRNRAAAAALVLSAAAVILSFLAVLFAAGILGTGGRSPASFEAQTREYLLDNPEVVVEALQLLEQRRQAAEANELEAVVAGRRDELFNDPEAPASGNPDGDVTLVEFFDYNCPYCRKATPLINQALKADPGLKFVYKEWPILGGGSEFAARAALASRKQGSYAEFHAALMAYSGSISQSSTLAVAEQVGLDIERLKRDMEEPSVTAAIERNRRLADELRITGTPAFVVGTHIIRGLVDLGTLQQFIAEARTQAKG